MSRRKWTKGRSRWERSLGICKKDPAGRWLRENDPLSRLGKGAGRVLDGHRTGPNAMDGLTRSDGRSKTGKARGRACPAPKGVYATPGGNPGRR